MALFETAINRLTLLRELSDGFQYRDVEDGTTKCKHCGATGKVEEWFDPADPERGFEQTDMLDIELVTRLVKREVKCPVCKGKCEIKKMRRVAKEVPCPKVKVLKELLEENEEQGRVVIFAGFTGSVDRVTTICLDAKWDVVRCDGRGFYVLRKTPEGVDTLHAGKSRECLEYWADTDGNERVAFVAHPESGGLSLTLTEARMAVFWSNSFKPEFRVQAEDRIHRPGMDNRGCFIVDLLHLPTDEKVLEVIRQNRKVELMTLGDFSSLLKATGEEVNESEKEGNK